MPGEEERDGLWNYGRAMEEFGMPEFEPGNGARRFQHPSPPRPELERLLKESAERVGKMTDAERRKMVDEQVRNIMPFAEDRVRQGLSRFVELTDKVAAGLKEENVKRDELRIGRVTPLTVGDGERKGIVSGGCVKRDPFEPMLPRPYFDPAREAQEKENQLREAAEKYRKLRESQDQPTDDISLFEKQLREARCPICGAHEACDHSKEERIREFARAGIRASKLRQAGAEAQKELDAVREKLSKAAAPKRAKDDGPSAVNEKQIDRILEHYLGDKEAARDRILNHHGCQGLPDPQKPALKDVHLTIKTPDLTSFRKSLVETKQPRILVVVSTEAERFRLRTLTTDARFLIVLPIEALPLAEKFAAVVVACRDHIQKLDFDMDCKLERDTLRTWLNGLRYVTINRDLKDVIYL